VPFFGYVSDTLGPRPLSLLAAVLFGSGYCLAAVAYRGLHLRLLVFGFFLVGSGTAASYFAGLISCAKVAPKRHRGILLALPIACYGVSPFWMVYVSSIDYFTLRGQVDVVRLYIALAILLVLVGFLGAVVLNTDVRKKTEEEEALLDSEGEEGDDDQVRGRPFFSEWTMYGFALGLFLILGSAEMYINNV
jgi:MFS family permease